MIAPELVALDVGGTHARFALAKVNNGTIKLGEPVTLKTSDYAKGFANGSPDIGGGLQLLYRLPL